MNKANVFLLVVVSSLLTYISTATQPAATAGVSQVGQEKWEYFRGMDKYLELRGKTRVDRSMPAGSCSTYSETPGLVGLEIQVILNEGIDSSLKTISFNTVEESSRYLHQATNRLMELSGEYGWQVFQVEERDTQFGTESVMHWRRRVQ